MQSVGKSLIQTQTIRNAWRLIYPFWVSEHKWKAYGLFAYLLLQVFISTYLSVWFNTWNGRFMDALAQYDKATIWQLMMQFALIVSGFIGVAVLGMLASSSLQIIWRQWLTERFIDKWFTREAFYRIEREQSVDNPDQRITEDINLLVTYTCSLSLGLVGTMASLVSFSIILWQLSGPLTFELMGIVWTLPGYMFWLAVIYALGTSALIHWIGRRLMQLEFSKQRAEADFRFMMAQVRGHAEQVALYHGSEAESQRMKRGFDAIRLNFWQIVRFNLRFAPVNTLLNYVSMIVGMVLVLPRYFAHAVTLGGMTQLSNAFGTVYSNLSWFIDNYKILQEYRVIVARLSGLEQAFTARAKTQGAEVDYQIVSEKGLIVRQLSLNTPTGRYLTEGINLSLKAGDRCLIQGPSGVGKSTLIRALAGIWPYGRGEICIPQNAKMLFLAQKNYVPPGTLKAALCYPSRDDVFSDTQCKDALQACFLAGYVDSLETVAPWGQSLSPGEQQRLAIARALLHRPDYLFLDESTSALDVTTEKALYELLIKHLSSTVFVSVAHRPSLEIFHTSRLEMREAALNTN